MKLVIHDLNPEEWEQIREEYAENDIISDNGKIQPCIGCFSCWNRTPGQCVIHDGYENMGKLIHDAEEVVVISRYTWGGFSSFVKGVFDRSLGYVLPQCFYCKKCSFIRKLLQNVGFCSMIVPL